MQGLTLLSGHAPFTNQHVTEVKKARQVSLTRQQAASGADLPDSSIGVQWQYSDHAGVAIA